MKPAAPVISTLFNTFSCDFKIYARRKDTRNKLFNPFGTPIDLAMEYWYGCPEHQKNQPFRI